MGIPEPLLRFLHSLADLLEVTGGPILVEAASLNKMSTATISGLNDKSAIAPPDVDMSNPPSETKFVRQPG
jgi:hypothetical protein